MSAPRFPHAVRTIEHVFVPMRDGVRLAARIWLPANATAPVPAILESIPYRKRDGTRQRDERMHAWFAGHGYAAVRLDVRGTGDSEGLLTDEYSEAEQSDTVEAIAWIAAQPWCDGNVGMIGKSWGGFAALQAAVRRPPELRAIVTVCASDDRFTDDAHFRGGCLLADNLLWGSVLMAICAQPPDPEFAGAAWQQRWHERLAAIEPFPAMWLRHPTRDASWRRGSVAGELHKVRIPVFAVGGWADGYSNAVLRLLRELPGPRHGLIGPWGHSYPHEGVPGPAFGFLQEVCAFFDRWLRGIDNGFERQPLLRAFRRDSARPEPVEPDRRGRWLAEHAWPSPRVRMRRLLLQPGRIVDADVPANAPREATLVHRSRLTVGAAGGSWCSFGYDGDEPGDQRDDDAGSLCFDSEPLADCLPLLGAPVVRLRLAVDCPAAQVCVRLCEVFPDGASARVSMGLLDLAHRQGHDRPLSVPVATPIDVAIRLDDLAHVFAPGNRVRLAISTSYWPMVWPAPTVVTLTLWPWRCSCELPERPDHDDDARLPALPPATSAEPAPITVLHPGGATRREDRMADGRWQVATDIDLEPDGSPSLLRFDDLAIETGHGIRESCSIDPDDPASARADVLHRTLWRRNGVTIEIELTAALQRAGDGHAFAAELLARRDGALVAHRRWDELVAPARPAPA